MKELILDGLIYKLPGGLTEWQTQMYIHLINWKWGNITKSSGLYKWKGKEIEYDALLPESVFSQFPVIYPSVLPELQDHLAKYSFKLHKYFNHMASSQVANINLFLPVLLHPQAENILTQLKPDLQRIAYNELYKGFRIEYWSGNSDKDTGILGDHSPAAGTDSDIAIAYYNKQDELCLWLIEHKLTEKEFTTCGGYKSADKSNPGCNNSFSKIVADKDLCHYHKVCRYKYWNITDDNQSFFPNHMNYESCPFKGGMNQLWRNQLLGLALEQKGDYKNVYFSVVHHPDNNALQRSIDEYKKLTDNNPKFSAFTSFEIIKIAENSKDAALQTWIAWYKTLYNIQ